MKIIVGGAGSVGESVVSYLAQGNNDIIVVDTNSKNLDNLSQTFDIRPILGSIAHPDILEKAGAKNADLLLAVTNSDEANMTACQVAYSLFKLPQRIARIDSDAYLSPLWSPLFNENNIPVDSVVSPDKSIASAIYRLLKVPGASEHLPLWDDQLYLMAFRCSEHNPLLQTPLDQLGRIAPELNVSFLCLVRGSRNMLAKDTDVMQAGDEVYFLVGAAKIADAIHAFDMEKPMIERVVIFGGNQISLDLARKLEQDDSILSSKIIEEDSKPAKMLAKELDKTIVINDHLLSDMILEEAAIEHADVAIAVTAHDNDNLLVSLLAKQGGATSVISLVNSRSNNTLVDSIGGNVIVDRASVTISALLKELRKNKINEAYSLGRGFGEIWDITISEEMSAVGHKISSLRLGVNGKIGAILRSGKIFYPDSTEFLQIGDRIIVYVCATGIRKAEQIFS